MFHAQNEIQVKSNILFYNNNNSHSLYIEYIEYIIYINFINYLLNI